MPMQRWIASAAGGTSHRLKPACAMIRSRSSKPAPAPTWPFTKPATVMCVLSPWFSFAKQRTRASHSALLLRKSSPACQGLSRYLRWSLCEDVVHELVTTIKAVPGESRMVGPSSAAGSHPRTSAPPAEHAVLDGVLEGTVLGSGAAVFVLEAVVPLRLSVGVVDQHEGRIVF